MGMGEPSDNAENVVKATKILTTREMFQLSASKVTVSTVAPTPSSFLEFAQSPCILAWSVHAVNDQLRKKLVPTTKYTMVELRQGFIDALFMKPMNARTCMLEVALMKDVNDQLHHADELAEFTQFIIDSVPGVKPHINLIPYNDIGPPSPTIKKTEAAVVSGISTPPVRYERPYTQDVVAFQKRLQSHGMYVHVRSTRGDDKTAACGQLATKAKKQQNKMLP
jgi:23S rRNA (adenine2503-C2)-methyltransferase